MWSKPGVSTEAGKLSSHPEFRGRRAGHNKKASVPSHTGGYLRNSDEAQELSVDQQRELLLPWCKAKKYRIIREYVDEGLSGSKNTEKRTDFLRLIKDSAKKEFQAVCCWDASRFARLDSIGSGVYKDALRTNGVVLDTIKDGRIDWNSDEGRMKDFLLSEANRKHSINLSVDSLRGRLHYARAGWWPHGDTPYGFDKEVHHDGKTLRVPRGEKHSKGDQAHVRLLPNDAEAKIIRRIFTEFNNGASIRAIVAGLNKQGVPSADGGTWAVSTVARMLRNHAYVGTVVIGRTQKGHFNKAEYTEIENSRAITPIISREVWDEAQDRINVNKEESRKAQPSRAGLLSGILKCGHCGFRLVKKSKLPTLSTSVRLGLLVRTWGVASGTSRKGTNGT